MPDPLVDNYESIPGENGDYRYCWSKGHVNLDEFAAIVAAEEYLDWLILDEGECYDEKENPTPELLNHIKSQSKYRWATITDEWWEFAGENDENSIPVTVFIY